MNIFNPNPETVVEYLEEYQKAINIANEALEYKGDDPKHLVEYYKRKFVEISKASKPNFLFDLYSDQINIKDKKQTIIHLLKELENNNNKEV